MIRSYRTVASRLQHEPDKIKGSRHIATVVPVQDEDEAIRVANDSRFGLGAAVFTSDTARGEQIAAKQLEAGSCFVNAPVRSDPRLPFGGIKDSGYGRELGSYGIKEFVNIKTVFVG